jgi:protein O-GlcNAc transferase
MRVVPRTLDTPTGGVSVDEALSAARQRYAAGDLAAAEALCRGVLKARPDHPQALYRLAKINLRAGIRGLAVAFASRAVTLDPEASSYHLVLGNALQAAGKPEQAEAAIRRALALAPADPKVHVSLAGALTGQRRLEEAVEVLQRAAEIAPETAVVHVALAAAWMDLGRAADALASFRRAMELAPQWEYPHSGVLFTRHYVADGDRAAAFAEARRWGTRHADPLSPGASPYPNEPDPERRLRIGYVSPDLRAHPVGQILRAVLAAHNRTHVEIFCYANCRRADLVGAELAAAADHWRGLLHLGDGAAAEVIRADQIDILVDLAGHTADNRLLMLARKPAPVQALWLGYFDTTGMASMDYIIGDHHVCPVGDEPFYTERLIRLSDSFFCYSPALACPNIAPLPLLSRGFVTFGSFNNLAKITPEVVALWAAILCAVPGSRICLKYFGLDAADARYRYLAMFAEHGVTADRITLLGKTPLAAHLATYAQIDIALDPFPYNGGMTTLDALWMGVPVISLAGHQFVGRMGASVLSAAGLADLIAQSAEEYVAKAISLADDPERLARLRGGLREQMAQSPLCDGARFARSLEAAYREMWRAWCQTRAA